MTLRAGVDYMQKRESQELYLHKDIDDLHLVIIRYSNYPLMHLCEIRDQNLVKQSDISEDFIREHPTDPDWYITCDAYIGKTSANYDKRMHLIAE